MSFGLAALMYLVSGKKLNLCKKKKNSDITMSSCFLTIEIRTDELLVKAHENKEDDWWYVTLQFFVGFSLILLMVIH